MTRNHRSRQLPGRHLLERTAGARADALNAELADAARDHQVLTEFLISNDAPSWTLYFAARKVSRGPMKWRVFAVGPLEGSVEVFRS